jgi:hypothetical protein
LTDDEVSHLYRANRDRYERRDLLTTRPLSPEDIPAAVGDRWERHIILSDYHHRNYVERDWVNGQTHVRQAHDEGALAVAERFMQVWEPSHIHLAGDMVDFHTISHFCKTPPGDDELNESLHALAVITRRIRMAHPRAEMNYYLGNHEVRWQHFIGGVAAQLGGFQELTYSSILRAQENRLNIYPYKRRVPVLPGRFEITHGDRVRGKSGVTAHAMLDKGVSGVSGHTHRLGMVYRTNRVGTVVWAENGCLCRLDPEWLEDPDWQQGFTVAYVDRAEGRFHLDQIPIIKGRVFYAGMVYEVG